MHAKQRDRRSRCFATIEKMSHNYYEQFSSFEDVEKKYGTSYYLATLFFPRKIKEATFALYTWFRIPDEIVDNAPSDSQKETELLLQDFITKWDKAYNERESVIPNLKAVSDIFHDHTIPFTLSQTFLRAMIQDLHTNRYKTYQDVEEYMDGSAAAVGLIMSHVIGFEDGALPYAQKLGYAMQLSNFIRDIKEDIDERDRIYFPTDEFSIHTITEQDFVNHNVEALRPFIKTYTDFTHNMYDQALPGIFMLKNGRFAVAYAAFLYRGILEKVEQADYDVFSARVYTTKRDKIALLCKTIVFLIRKK